jgi:hypothetical protein
VSTDASLFESFGISADEIPELSSGPGPGVYDAKISKAEVVKKTDDDGTVKISLVIDYTIDGFNFPVKEFLSLPNKPKSQWDHTVTGQKNGRDISEASTNEFKFGLVVKRYLSLGIPAEQHNSVKPSDLVDIECVITLAPQRNNPQYTNVVKVSQKREPVDVTPGAVGGVASAAEAPKSRGGLWD